MPISWEAASGFSVKKQELELWVGQGGHLGSVLWTVAPMRPSQAGPVGERHVPGALPFRRDSCSLSLPGDSQGSAGNRPGADSVLSRREGVLGRHLESVGSGRNADPLCSESCSAALSLKVVQQHSPRLRTGRYAARRVLGHRQPDCSNHWAVRCGHSLFQTMLLSPVRIWIVFSILWSLLLRVTPSFRSALLPCGQGNLLHPTWTAPGTQQRKTQGAPPTITSCAGERAADGRQPRSSCVQATSFLLSLPIPTCLRPHTSSVTPHQLFWVFLLALHHVHAISK